MQKSQEGDEPAYRALLLGISKVAKRSLSRRLNQEEAIDDVVQDVLISVNSAKHTYDPARPFLPWLHALIEHRLSDYWRKSFRISNQELQDEGFLESVIDPQSQNSYGADSAYGDEFERVLNLLPEKQRLALLLTKKDGLTVKEAATHLSISEASIKVNVHRALIRLRKLLLGKEDHEN